MFFSLPKHLTNVHGFPLFQLWSAFNACLFCLFLYVLLLRLIWLLFLLRERKSVIIMINNNNLLTKILISTFCFSLIIHGANSINPAVTGRAVCVGELCSYSFSIFPFVPFKFTGPRSSRELRGSETRMSNTV